MMQASKTSRLLAGKARVVSRRSVLSMPSMLSSTHVRPFASQSNKSNYSNYSNYQNGSDATMAYMAALGAVGAMGAMGAEQLKHHPTMSAMSAVCQCESITPSNANPDDEEFYQEHDDENLPEIRMSEVEKHNGDGESSDGGGNSVWMTYGGYVYDVTDFIANHPGGSEKILLAAGGPIEPHWHLYRQHFASDLPLRLMEKMIIGKLHPADQEAIDDVMEQLSTDPYGLEPERNPLLHVHSDTPMNAEVPHHLLTREYLTPNDLFYVRHHHPVPLLEGRDLENYRLEVDVSLLSGDADNIDDDNVAKLTLEQIKSLPKVELVTTLQCSGNRRSGFNDLRRTSGTEWGQGAISTAKWGGARLVDVLVLAAEELKKSKKATKENETEVDEGQSRTKTKRKKKCKKGCKSSELAVLQTLQSLQTTLANHPRLNHLRFESLDGMLASIDAEKALSPFGDVMIAYEMNDEPLPRDHGFPLRVIVPGYAAVRNVKWLKRLELAEEEAEGAWQRGLNYKILPPSITDAKNVDLNQMPGLGEVAVFSGITHVDKVYVAGQDTQSKVLRPGDTVLVNASGWAWAGGGRNIVRVDISGNHGKTWETTTLTQGSNQPYKRAWAWTFWTADAIPATVCEDGCSVELCCKGVDMCFNTQPEGSDGLWNVRGLGNNSWYRLRYQVVEGEDD